MPVKFRYTYQRSKIAPDLMREEWSRTINEWWDAAISEFAEASQAATRVDTGMSASSFVPLSRAVGGSLTPIIGGPPKAPYTDIHGNVYPHIQKSPEQGMAEGEKAFKINYMTRTHSTLVFEYVYHVYQLALYTEQKGDAWGVKAAGQEAFRAYLRQGTSRVIHGLRRAIRRDFETTKIKW